MRWRHSLPHPVPSSLVPLPSRDRPSTSSSVPVSMSLGQSCMRPALAQAEWAGPEESAREERAQAPRKTQDGAGC
jgi:hypothetical protein